MFFFVCTHHDTKASPPAPTSFLRSVKVTHRKVLRLLLSLDESKTTGSDKVPASFLKAIAHILCRPLAHIFSLSLKTGVFPDMWKIVDVVALHKKKSKSDPGNYRPISLLSIMSKVFEHIVNDRLKRFLAPKLHQHRQQLQSQVGSGGKVGGEGRG